MTAAELRAFVRAMCTKHHDAAKAECALADAAEAAGNDYAALMHNARLLTHVTAALDLGNVVTAIDMLEDSTAAAPLPLSGAHQAAQPGTPVPVEKTGAASAAPRRYPPCAGAWAGRCPAHNGASNDGPCTPRAVPCKRCDRIHDGVCFEDGYDRHTGTVPGPATFED